jgi:tRNA-Thr(GGU) m(6)t(6)A37 methyltransferase TsaA
MPRPRTTPIRNQVNPSSNPSLQAAAVESFPLHPVAVVESPLRDRREAPRQGQPEAPEAWLVFKPEMRAAIRDLAAGDQIIVLTWLDRASREVLTTVPGDDPAGPERGVFSTRSPDRPNPVGLHRVRILAVDGMRIRVDHLEALDGTPVVDVKPVLDVREG